LWSDIERLKADSEAAIASIDGKAGTDVYKYTLELRSAADSTGDVYAAASNASADDLSATVSPAGAVANVTAAPAILVEEVQQYVDRQGIIAAVPVKFALETPADDIFNVALNYGCGSSRKAHVTWLIATPHCRCTGYDDIKRLTETMFPVAKRYKWLLTSEMSAVAAQGLKLFISNYEKLLNYLKEIESCLVPAVSHLGKLQQLAGDANSGLRAMAEIGAVFHCQPTAGAAQDSCALCSAYHANGHTHRSDDVITIAEDTDNDGGGGSGGAASATPRGRGRGGRSRARGRGGARGGGKGTLRGRPTGSSRGRGRGRGSGTPRSVRSSFAAYRTPLVATTQDFCPVVNAVVAELAGSVPASAGGIPYTSGPASATPVAAVDHDAEARTCYPLGSWVQVTTSTRYSTRRYGQIIGAKLPSYIHPRAPYLPDAKILYDILFEDGTPEYNVPDFKVVDYAFTFKQADAPDFQVKPYVIQASTEAEADAAAAEPLASSGAAAWSPPWSDVWPSDAVRRKAKKASKLPSSAGKHKRRRRSTGSGSGSGPPPRRRQLQLEWRTMPMVMTMTMTRMQTRRRMRMAAGLP
jgi:hypothetical protein